MNNSEIAEVFKRIAILMEIKGEDWFKISAYRRASETIQGLEKPLKSLDEKALMALPGIGKALAGKILELNASGKLAFLEKLEAEVPPALIDLLAVPEIGARKAALFWQELGITTLGELEAAARAGKLRCLTGMGEKSEERILRNLEMMKSSNS